jgi:hypothetical protein
MLTRKTRMLLTLTAAAPLLIAGCTDNNIFDPGQVAGTYDLTLYAGIPISEPPQFTSDPGIDPELPNGGTVIVDGGNLVMNSDGTFVETNFLTKIPPSGSSFTTNFVSTGTFQISGTTVSFFAPAQNGFSPRSFSGNLSTNRVDYFEQGFEFEYQK